MSNINTNPKYSIDKAKIRGKDYKYLENKIIEKYKETFPDYEITIKYKNSKHDYTFLISKKDKIINEEGNIELIDVYLCKYINSTAIDIFAKDKKEELYQKYYYDQIDYFEQLQEFLDSIVTLYKLQNINLEYDIKDNKTYFVVYGPKPESYTHYFGSSRSIKLFYLKYSDCVTKDEFIKLKRDVSNFIKIIAK